MRAVLRSSRPRHGHTAGTPVLLALLLAIPAAVCGCGTIDGTQRMVDRATLVNDLATKLDASSALTYTAGYQMAGGQQASITQAQHPARTSYRYPGGSLLLLPGATADCRTAPEQTCTLTPPPSPGDDPPQALLAGLTGHGLIAPATVISLLTAASLDSNAIIEQHDSTVAGQHATCVDASGVDNAAASSFSTCVTTDGVLGTFDGVVDGTPVHVELIHYDQSAADTAFAMPDGARVVDRRPH